jgi:universal stress protein E
MKNVWKRIVVATGDPQARSSRALRKGAEIARRSSARLYLFHAYAPPAGLYNTFDTRTVDRIVGETVARQRKGLERLARPLRRRGIDVHTDLVWDFPPHEAVVRFAVKQKADLVVAYSRRHGRLARWFLTNTDWELIRQCPCPLWFVKSPTLRPKIRVLAAVDPFHARAKPARLDDRILQSARQVARLLGGKAAACHAYTPPASYLILGDALGQVPVQVPGLPDQVRRYTATVRKALNRLAQRYGIPAAARFIETGDPATVLPRLTRRLSSDLLVMGAVSRTGLKRLLIGGTAERVIDEVSCDVLIVKPDSLRAMVPRRARMHPLPIP